MKWYQSLWYIDIMKKFLPILFLLLAYIIFVGGITTFKSLQETNEQQKQVQQYLNGREQRKVDQIQPITPEVGFVGGNCFQGLSNIVVITIINLIPLVVLSIMVALIVWIISIFFGRKISIDYKQKVITVGIISLIGFELIINQFAQMANQTTFYQPVFFPLCM